MRKATEDHAQNGRPDIDWFFQQPLQTQLEMVTNYLELAILMLNQLMGNEVRSLAGTRYNRDRPQGGRYQRWGSNPGSVRIGTQRIPVSVPRVYDTQEEAHRPLTSYTTMRTIDRPS